MRGQRNNLSTTLAAIIALAALIALPINAPAQLVAKTVQTTQVNVDNFGAASTAGSAMINSDTSISAFGRYIAFADISALDPNDTNGFTDVYVRDLQTGTTTRVSVDSAGNQGNEASGADSASPGPPGGSAHGIAISFSGRFVVFNSRASNLVANDTNALNDTFLHDRDVAGDGVFDQPGDISTIRVSVDSAGNQTNSIVTGQVSVSRDGRWVAFGSSATNLVANDTNGIPDIFLHDTFLRTTSRINVSSGNAQDNGTGPQLTMISPDGRFVLFTSDASSLVAGDNNAVNDVFIRDLDTDVNGVSNEPGTLATFRISVDTAGGDADAASFATHMSYDGRLVVFTSSATDLVANDTNSFADVFVRDVFAQTTTRVSVSPTGVEGNGSSGGGLISSDGRFVLFRTGATNVAPSIPNPGGGPNITVTGLVLKDRDVSASGTLDTPGNISVIKAEILPDGSFANASGPGHQNVGLSAGGRVVLFEDTTLANGGLYVRENGLDSDGDGLLDSWEANGGIDLNADGTMDLLLPGAQVLHKDIYLEVDVMLCDPNRAPFINNLNLSTASYNTLVQRFASIPNTITQNPDGLPGISLHVQVDRTNIPFQVFDPNAPWAGPTTPPFAPSATFTSQRQLYFGTAAERTSGVWNLIEPAKRLTHHYGLIAYSEGATTVGGRGEMPGNAFYITMGNWNGAGTQAQRAGVFAHELGHNLGLDHGGRDPILFKPNYRSYMDYEDTLQSACYGGWQLTMSRSTMGTLDENCLDETTGIVGGRGANFRVPFRPPVQQNCNITNINPCCPIMAPEAGPVDWDGSSNLSTCAVADVNTVQFGAPPTPGEILFGHNDAANLWLPLVGASSYYNGPSATLSPDGDFTRETLIPIDDQPNIVDDFNLYDTGPANFNGFWEVWCEGGQDATITDMLSRSAPNSLQITRPDSGPIGSDIVIPLSADACTWELRTWTYVPSATAGSGFIVMLNQYCEPTDNFSMQVEFDGSAGVVRAFNGAELPLLLDQWVEFRAVIDLSNDRLSQFYNGQPLNEDLVWTLNVSGQLGDPGIPQIAALNLVAQDIREMFFDDLSFEFVDCDIQPPCEADWNLDTVVNVLDLLDYLAGWFEGFPDRDINFDGFVDVQDLLQFLAAWFLGCE